MLYIGHLRFILIISFVFTLSACGGGGGKNKGGGNAPPAEAKFILKGKVQKGLFSQLVVTAYSLDNATGELGDPIETTSTDSNYSLALSEAGYYQLEAAGTFIDETTGEDATLADPLLAIIEVQADIDVTTGETAAQTEVDTNLNLYTTMAALQVTSRVADGATVEAALPVAETFVQQTVGLAADVDLSALDLTEITSASALSDPNLQLLLFSASVLQNSSTDVIDAAVADFGSYTSPAEASSGLSVLGGTNAASLYDIIQPYLDGLPTTLTVLETDEPVYVCIQNCGWTVYSAPAMSITGFNMLESDAKFRLTISLNRAINKDVQVRVSSVDVSAVKGVDYKPVSELITIPANQLSVNFFTELILDARDEPTEYVRYELTAIGEDYTFAQQYRDVRISDGYGALEASVDGSVVISSVCLSGIGDGLNLESSGCLNNAPTGIPDKDTAGLAIDLSLETACALADITCINASSHHWLVEFGLETFDAKFGTAIAELKLGDYWFPGNKVYTLGESVTRDTVYFNLNSQAASLFDTAKRQNLPLRVTARLVQSAAQTPAQTEVSSNINQPFRLPESITAGDRVLEYLLNSVSQTPTCNGDNYLIDAQYSLDGSVYTNGELCVATSTGQNGDVQGVLQDNQRLSLVGMQLTLPESHSVHIAYNEDRIQTRGAEYLTVPTQYLSYYSYGAVARRLCDELDCYRGQDLLPEDIISPLPLSLYLQAEGLPFAFRIETAYLDNKGIHLIYDNVKYLHSGEYSQYDDRKNGDIISNDVFYKNVNGQSGELLLTSAGVTTELTSAAGTGDYAFPVATFDWSQFKVYVVNSIITKGQGFTADMRLSQNKSCAECVRLPPLIYEMEGLIKLDQYGNSLTQMTVTTGNQVTPTWGIVANKAAYQRPDDLKVDSTAMLALPGYRFRADENEDGYEVGLDVQLLGHIAQAEGDLPLYSLLTETALEGNEWPTGLTVGPELYTDDTGSPIVGNGRSLQGKTLSILNQDDGTGNSSTFDFPVNIGAKYVIRNSGITGVFNVALETDEGNMLANSQSIKFSGYDMQFDRFAFRLTDNTHDDFSWIDGLVYIPGVGDFVTNFTSLSLGCDAKLGSGVVSYCGTDECQQRLLAWHAYTDVLSMGFEDDSADGVPVQACQIGKQILAFEQTVDMLAVDKPIGLSDVRWTPEGGLDNSRLSPLQSMILDGSDNKRGFAIRPTQGTLRLLTTGQESNYGVLSLTNSRFVAGNFWAQMRTDIRLANTSKTMAEKTVVVKGNSSPAITQLLDADSNNQLAEKLVLDEGDYTSYSPRATYNWGGLFDFDLPVYYESGGLVKSASFYGRKENIDLLIMPVDAGIDYIEPRKTRLSFGISAETSKIGGFSSLIDISDYVTLENMDYVLDGIGLGDFSLTDTFNLLSVDLSVMRRFGDRGIKSGIREALDAVFDKFDRVVINGVSGEIDIWREIAEPLSAVTSLPDQISALLEGSITQRFDTGIYQKSLLIRGGLQALSAKLQFPALTDVMLKDLESQNPADRSYLLSVLGAIELQINPLAQESENLQNEMEKIQQRMLKMLDSAKEQIDRALPPLNTLNDVLKSAVDIQNFCSSDSAPTTSFVIKAGVKINTSSFISPIEDLSESITEALKKFRQFSTVMSLLKIGFNQVLTEYPDLLRQLDETTLLIEYTSEQLDLEWAEAQKDLQDLICNETGFALADIPGDIRDDIVQPIVDNLTLYKNSINVMKNDINTQFSASINRIKAFNRVVRGMVRVMASAKMAIEQPTLGEFNLDGSATLEALYNKIVAELSNISGGKITALYVDESLQAQAELEGRVDFHYAEVFKIKLMLSEMSPNLRTALFKYTFPGFYYTPDEFKNYIVNEIMDSEPMGELWRSADQYFKGVISELTGIKLDASDTVNKVLKAAVSELASPVNDLINDITSKVPNIPVTAGKLDGYAVISGDALQLLHVQGEWSTDAQNTDIKGNTFYGAFEAKRYIVGSEDDTSSFSCGFSPGRKLFDTGISASGPIEIGDGDAYGSLEINFSFADGGSSEGTAYLPNGFNGRINIEGNMPFEAFTLYDIGFTLGISPSQAYVGAGGMGYFEITELSLYAFLGRTCNATTVSDNDPQIKDLLDFQPDEPFTGLYARGSVTIPLFPYPSCFFDISARVSIGYWLTVEPKFAIGAVNSGGLIGSFSCIGSVRGEMTTVGEIDSSGDIYFAGRIFVVAGAGKCDRNSWTSIKRSRKDSWCGTADIGMKVKYKNSDFIFEKKYPSAIY